MLYIKFGAPSDVQYMTASMFDLEFETEWFNNPLVKEMILDVDKSEVTVGRVIESPVLGPISPMELSGGVKLLIMMLYEPDEIYWGTSCGDNCAKWILKIAEMHDLTLHFGHLMDFPEPFEIHVLNSGNAVRNMLELIGEYGRSKVVNADDWNIPSESDDQEA